MTQEQVLKMTGAKHVKIYKLNQLGLTNKDIAALLGTNVGHVYNVLKDYRGNETKANAANAITV